jgi:hypothetical protein
MPKFVIERQYLVPMYQHIVVEAENLAEACTKGISDDIDWDTQEMDCDSARATTITNAKVIPEDKFELADDTCILFRNRGHQPRCGVEGYALSTFLYEDDEKTGPLLKIPEQFTDDE